MSRPPLCHRQDFDLLMRNGRKALKDRKQGRDLHFEMTILAAVFRQAIRSSVQNIPSPVLQGSKPWALASVRAKPCEL